MSELEQYGCNSGVDSEAIRKATALREN